MQKKPGFLKTCRYETTDHFGNDSSKIHEVFMLENHMTEGDGVSGIMHSGERSLETVDVGPKSETIFISV